MAKHFLLNNTGCMSNHHEKKYQNGKHAYAANQSILESNESQHAHHWISIWMHCLLFFNFRLILNSFREIDTQQAVEFEEAQLVARKMKIGPIKCIWFGVSHTVSIKSIKFATQFPSSSWVYISESKKAQDE